MIRPRSGPDRPSEKVAVRAGTAERRWGLLVHDSVSGRVAYRGADEPARSGAEPSLASRRWRPRTADGGEQMIRSEDTEQVASSHLDDVENGCGCAEICEQLSDWRDGVADE